MIFKLMQRIQFTYNNFPCQGTVVQIISGTPQQIVVEIDVSNNYAALPYNRIILDENTTNIISVIAPSWY